MPLPSMITIRFDPVLRRQPWRIMAFALLLALAARHGLIEPEAVARLCEPEDAPWWCMARHALVMSFAWQGLATVALGAGLAAWAMQVRSMAYVAVMAGVAGLVLYNPDWSAVGLLSGLLAFAVLPMPGANRRG